jgi:hypothetical protein
MSKAIADAMLKLFFDNQQAEARVQPLVLSSSQLLKQLMIAEIAALKDEMWAQDQTKPPATGQAVFVLNIVIVAGEGTSTPSRAKTTRSGDPGACAPHFSRRKYRAA